MRGLLSLSLGLAVVAGASMASAQDMGGSSSSSSSSQSSSGGSSGSGGGSITDTSGPTDHSVVVGHLGLHYFGGTTMFALPAAGSGLPTFGGGQGAGTVPAPQMSMGSSPTLHTVGVRYWLNNALGLEGGLSLGFSNGTFTRTTPTMMGTTTDQNDDPVFFGFGFQFGVPLMLAESKHVNIQFIPYLALHFASAGITRGNTDNATDFSSSSFQLTIGGNTAAEVHLGFLGMPQISLSAQMGIALRYRSATNIETPRRSNISTTSTQSAFGFGTTIGPNFSLSDIIAGSIAVTYYWGRPG